MLKKITCGVCAAVLISLSVVTLSGCGEAEVNFTLSEDGTYYIVSGVSGNKTALKTYDVPEFYAPEEGHEALPVKEIGEEAFMGCTRLINITIPEGIEKIGDRAFSKCMFPYFTIPESVTYIGYGAFGMCDGLKEIVIPQSVTTLDALAFAYCSNLETATVKANIAVLNEKVFVNSVVNAAGNVYTDTSLTKVYLPATLTKIHSTALSGNRISDIYFAGSEGEWDELYFFNMQQSEEDEDVLEEVRLKKDEVLSDSVTVHFNVQF